MKCHIKQSRAKIELLTLLVFPLVLNGGLPSLDFSDKQIESISSDLIGRLKKLDPSLCIKERESKPKRDFLGTESDLVELAGSAIKGRIYYESAYNCAHLFGPRHPAKIGVDLQVSEEIYNETKRETSLGLRPTMGYIWGGS